MFILGGYAVLKAQQGNTSTAVKGGRWSDAATWSGKKVPVDGAAVTIDKGMDVVLDVNTAPLHGLTINGKLSFADNKDVELT
ncbi:MAG TPA: G8 domain-containing protein, partial [Terriglobia bacterium]|nr:G8 domain-containing protein [Terriglobia bacterium]